MEHRQHRLTAGELRPICDGTFYVFSEPAAASNAGVVVADDQAVAIDARLTPRLGKELHDVIARMTEGSIVVVNTHWHGDHWFGNAGFEGSTVLASRYTRDRLIRDWGQQVERFASIRPQQADEFRAMTVKLPDIGLTTGTRVEVGERSLELECVEAAHTPGDLVVRGDGGRVVFSGDLVFNSHWPVLWDADVAGWVRVLGSLLEQPPDFVVPGHGEGGGPELVERMIECLELMQELAAMPESWWWRKLERSPFSTWEHEARIAAGVEHIRQHEHVVRGHG